jgi:hypothetical protein
MDSPFFINQKAMKKLYYYLLFTPLFFAQQTVSSFISPNPFEETTS